MRVAAVNARALTLVLLLTACAPAAISKLPVSCGAASGGQTGAETQLRFVEATDTQVVLTLGASAASNVFGVPAFDLKLLEGSSAPRSYRLRVNGTSSRNPDGTSSYTGLKTIEPGGRAVRNISFVDETARQGVQRRTRTTGLPARRVEDVRVRQEPACADRPHVRRRELPHT